MERYERIVLEAERGITFETIEKIDNEIIIRACNKEKRNIYSRYYLDPVVPNGYVHVMGEWYNGFVIQRRVDKSQFVWIPVGWLCSNGTLDGINFSEKFGRRNFCHDNFSQDKFHEELTEEFKLQIESIKKYGGFYISRYNISQNKKSNKPQSIKNQLPWTDVSFFKAKDIASAFEKNDTVTSHLPYGAEYDSILEWFLQSNAVTFKELVANSQTIGNHFNLLSTKAKNILLPTGKKKLWEVNNIFDFAGNVKDWTQELYNDSAYVLRGGSYIDTGEENPCANRRAISPDSAVHSLGFRIALCIK